MLDMAADTLHFEVFFIDTSTGWAVAEFDSGRNQQGDAEFHFHKRDAVKSARQMSQGVFEIWQFGKDGVRQANVKTSTTV